MHAILYGPTLHQMRTFPPKLNALIVRAAKAFDSISDDEQQEVMWLVGKAKANLIAIGGLQTALES